MTEKEWDTLDFNAQCRIIDSRVCPFCGGRIDTHTNPHEGWVVECSNCEYLFNED